MLRNIVSFLRPLLTILALTVLFLVGAMVWALACPIMMVVDLIRAAHYRWS